MQPYWNLDASVRKHGCFRPTKLSHEPSCWRRSSPHGWMVQFGKLHASVCKWGGGGAPGGVAEGWGSGGAWVALCTEFCRSYRPKLLRQAASLGLTFCMCLSECAVAYSSPPPGPAMEEVARTFRRREPANRWAQHPIVDLDLDSRRVPAENLRTWSRWVQFQPYVYFNFVRGGRPRGPCNNPPRVPSLGFWRTVFTCLWYGCLPCPCRIFERPPPNLVAYRALVEEYCLAVLQHCMRDD